MVSRCINDAVRGDYLMLLFTVLKNFKLLMMTEEFHKNLVQLGDWAVKYRRDVVINEVMCMGE